MEFTTMIVDDDEICLMLGKHVIESSAFQVAPQTFNCAQKELNFLEFRSDKGSTILMFLDINMPDISGWDLLDILQKDDSNKDLQVIVVSSSVDAADKEKAFSFSKVVDFLEEPLNEIAINELKTNLLWLELCPRPNS
jgi:CheY-like chemotaxis protein